MPNSFARLSRRVSTSSCGQAPTPAPSGILAAIRPGCCSEPGMVVRTSNPPSWQPASRWLHRLGQELAPLQSANGGPIIAVQVENEYGSFGSDHNYMEQIHHAAARLRIRSRDALHRGRRRRTARWFASRIACSHQLRQRRGKDEFAKLASSTPQRRLACAASTGMGGSIIGAKNITPPSSRPG